MAEKIKRVHSGLQIDGIDLLRGNCGCGGLTGPGGYGVGDCCMTYSTVKQEGNKVSFFSKGTTPNTTNNYEWGYRVKKGDMEIDVLVYDTKDKTDFEFGGFYAPPVSAWKDRGWEVLDQFERPLEGSGEKMPEWCKSAEYCVRPESTMESPKGDVFRKKT